ncbi:MAG: hypothetical protein GPJ54_08730 [Candidatus Heimdallarchaeota archaeon]|nr:hypothetical protein [Candidatus Heimdallarchaeota archaeon]
MYYGTFLTRAKNTFIMTILLLVVVNSVSVSGVNPNSITSSSGCGDPYVSIRIASAYYADVDLDGDEDDVFAEVLVDLYCSNRYQFDYYIYLTQPSGFQVYDALGVNTRLNQLTFSTTFYNYAMESGDYRIDVKILLMNGGPYLVTESIIFDPPGGVSGTGSIDTEVY